MQMDRCELYANQQIQGYANGHNSVRPLLYACQVEKEVSSESAVPLTLQTQLIKSQI